MVLDQVIVDDPPDAIDAGDAEIVTVGCGALIPTVTVFELEPPAPEQLNVYVPALVSAPVDCVPDVALLPDHEPLAVHDVALVLDHVSVDDPPEATLVGEALSETVGAGATVTVAL